jgi:hypothetical protein
VPYAPHSHRLANTRFSAAEAIRLRRRDLPCEVGISSGNQALTRCAFLDTNPTGDLITSGLSAIRK